MTTNLSTSQVNHTEFRPKIVAIVDKYELYMYAFEIVFYKKRENRSVGLLVVNLMDMLYRIKSVGWLLRATAPQDQLLRLKKVSEQFDHTKQKTIRGLTIPFWRRSPSDLLERI